MVLLTLGKSMGILKYGFGNILSEYFMLFLYLYLSSISINLSSSLISYLSIPLHIHHLPLSTHQYLNIYHLLLSIKTFVYLYIYVCMCMYLSKISQSVISIYLAIISQSVIYHLSLYVFLSPHNFINFIEVILY